MKPVLRSMLKSFIGCLLILFIIYPTAAGAIIELLNIMQVDIFSFIQLLGSYAITAFLIQASFYIFIPLWIFSFFLNKIKRNEKSKAFLFSIIPIIVITLLYPINLIIMSIFSVSFYITVMIVYFLTSYFVSKAIIFNDKNN